jgi:hypothetical protein
MVNKEDARVQLARYQKEIMDYLGMDSEHLVFEYNNYDGKTKLDLITVNPRHNQSFLFHSTVGVDRLEALKKMVEYVKQSREQENTYTVQWMSRGERELHTSYFRAKNVYEALDKLYYGRDINVITVYSVQLNPIS